MEGEGKQDLKKVIGLSQEWANQVHRDMIAATLLDPNLICFRSVATDEPEEVIRAKLMDEMTQKYVPKAHKDLQSFLPNLVGSTIK